MKDLLLLIFCPWAYYRPRIADLHETIGHLERLWERDHGEVIRLNSELAKERNGAQKSSRDFTRRPVISPPQ